MNEINFVNKLGDGMRLSEVETLSTKINHTGGSNRNDSSEVLFNYVNFLSLDAFMHWTKMPRFSATFCEQKQFKIDIFK